MKYFLALAFLISLLNSKAQTGYRADLQALRSTLEKMPSYRAQIWGAQLRSYDSLYSCLAADSAVSPSEIKYFLNLSRLFFPLRDNHLGFYQVVDYNRFRSKEGIEQYIASPEFSGFPKIAVNLDSLRTVLAKRSTDSIEGIYCYDSFYTVGLYRTADKEYLGVVLDSKIDLWKPGQLAICLFEFKPNLYKAIYSHPLTKAYIFQPIEKYRNQSLINSNFYGAYSQKSYSKTLRTTDHINLPADAPRYQLRKIGNDIQYLLVRSFQANNLNLQQSENFYDSIKNSLTAANLVLDLRNNEGGAEKLSKKYLELLNEYSKRGRLFVLINNGTISQAEIFLLELKKKSQVVAIGQETKGMLTYGSNYGRRVRLPSEKFEVYITDMRGNDEHLAFEDYGILPDISLSAEHDWIDQVVEIIRQNGADIK